MRNGIEYVLPLGRPNDEGHLTSCAWRELLRWSPHVADSILLWTCCGQAKVAEWMNLADTDELSELAHPDPAFPLRGYRAPTRLVDWAHVSSIPVSEEAGIAHFSWMNGDAVVAYIEVDDFENFAFLNVGRKDAARLARACREDLWDDCRFEEYRAHLDELSQNSNWLPLSTSLVVEE